MQHLELLGVVEADLLSFLNLSTAWGAKYMINSELGRSMSDRLIRK